jgi:hypothetical protein
MTRSVRTQRYGLYALVPLRLAITAVLIRLEASGTHRITGKTRAILMLIQFNIIMYTNMNSASGFYILPLE